MRRCILPDGEVFSGGVWAPRNPGVSVNYNIPWVYGGDNSQARKPNAMATQPISARRKYRLASGILLPGKFHTVRECVLIPWVT